MHRVPAERITIELDEDVLEVARDQEIDTGENLGKIISRMARHGHFALKGPVVYPDGFKPLPPRPLERIITNKFIEQIQEEIDLEDALRAYGVDEEEIAIQLAKLQH